MDDEIAVDASPMLRIYKNGRIERLLGTDIVPPGFDPKHNVESKDVVFCSEHGLTNRLYIPKDIEPGKKVPLLVYYHGGGFCVESPASPNYHNYLNALVAEAKVMVVSVDYRRAPEHPIPAAYDDSWAALKWVASHSEDWLTTYADLQKVFLAGDSAGGNIAYHMAMRIGTEKVEGLDVKGIVLVHPYFWGEEPVGEETRDQSKRAIVEGLWRLACPSSSSGCDDPWINPLKGEDLARLGCGKVLVFVAERDWLRHRGCLYVEKLKESGWGGEAELVEALGEEHVYHLFGPDRENAVAKLKKFAGFLNQNK